MISMLKSCVSEYGQTLVMITHDETIAQMADRMIVIEDGKVVSMKTVTKTALANVKQNKGRNFYVDAPLH